MAHYKRQYNEQHTLRICARATVSCWATATALVRSTFDTCCRLSLMASSMFSSRVILAPSVPGARPTPVSASRLTSPSPSVYKRTVQNSISSNFVIMDLDRHNTLGKYGVFLALVKSVHGVTYLVLENKWLDQLQDDSTHLIRDL